ncbi:MAG: hypothetical protein Q9212_004513 [Teloschistes hypoglaucus]
MIFLSRPYRRICAEPEKKCINDNDDNRDDFGNWSTLLSAKTARYLLVIANIVPLSIGSLVNEYHPHRFQLHYPFTAYRGPPSPAVNKAWEDLTEDSFMIVSDTDLHGQNFSSRPALRAFNGKDHGVLAKFEVFHALHCVVCHIVAREVDNIYS